MLFANETTVPVEYMGYLVLGLITLLGGAATIKHLLDRPSEKEAVPRKEFDELKVQVASRKEFDELKQQTVATTTAMVTLTAKLNEYATRSDVEKARNEFMQTAEKTETYARRRGQKLTESVTEIQLGMETLHRNIQSEISTLISKVMDKMERLQSVVHESHIALERRLPTEKDKEKDKS